MEEELGKEVRMQNFQKIAVTVAFSFTCFSVPVLGAAKAVSGGKAGESAVLETRGTAVGAVGDVAVIPGANLGTGAEGEVPGSVASGINRAADAPSKQDWLGSLATQVQALKDQFKKEHADLLKAHQEMLKQAKEVGKEERDKVREQFKVQRGEMIARQKELREELIRRFQEFRAEHPNHLDVIDAAKERAKEGIRERRGHGGE